MPLDGTQGREPVERIPELRCKDKGKRLKDGGCMAIKKDLNLLR
jgi:hypothetical protein